MKKIISIILCLVLILSLSACGAKVENKVDNNTSIKVGMVCIGDDNTAYDRNFYTAADSATKYFKEKGIEVIWEYKYNNPVEVADDCAELASDGCTIVFCNSYGQEPQALITAADYPETYFVGHTNYAGQADDLPNTLNAMPDISQGRYVAGVAAGCKLNELIENGTITSDKAIIGYVGAYTYSEVISGYTAFYLGAKSVCPSVTMLVEFIGSWGDMTAEAAATQDLIDRGAILISQHSDNTSPATVAQSNNAYHVGYNIAMDDVAPNASIISSRIDWTNFFITRIEQVINNEELPQDYMGVGFETGDIQLTELNSNIVLPGVEEAIEFAKNQLMSGEIHVFDTETFTVNGQHLTSSLIDTDADFEPDTEAIFDGYFHESYFCSAPQFAEKIDGITLVNEAY